MYIPSGSALELLKSEKYGVWAESFQNGDRTALIVKAPSSAIKAIVQGCDISLFVGVVTCGAGYKYLSIGVKISDSIDSPLFIPMSLRVEGEKKGILSLFKNKKFVFSMYDEMDTNVFAAKGIIDNLFSDSFFDAVNSISSITLVDNWILGNEITDSFCHEVDPAYGTARIHNSFVLSGDVTISNISTHLFMGHVPGNSINYNVGGGNEGLTQEKQLDHAISINFPGKVFHSPQVKIGSKQRELTDIMVSYDDHFYLIESKAASVNVSGFNKTLLRKQSGTIKQALKALKQLEGGLKAARRNEVITKITGETISIPKNGILHGIVVVSELVPMKQWRVVSERVYEVFSSTKCMIHVMDMSEFIYILKLSQQDTIHFNQTMIERFSSFYESGNLNIESMDSSLPYLPAN